MYILIMIQVTCAIILKGKKILVAQRNELMKLPLKWEFPGGKLNEGESERECILRELKEELGIEVRILRRLNNYEFDYGDFYINLIPFLVEYVKGEVYLTEHRKAIWVRKGELSKLDWAPADIPIVNQLLQSKYV
jgi:8-oxo-dGTP diphosphatase